MVAANNMKRKVNRLVEGRCHQLSVECRNDLPAAMARERALQEIASVSGIDDIDLAVRLHEAGFGPESLSALSLAPIVVIAWGSGEVTDHESRAAYHAIFDSELVGNPAAIAVFRGWLAKRPDKSLMSLWCDFVITQLDRVSPPTRQAILDRLSMQARQVALASGGILGYGSICEGEQKVLNQITALNVANLHAA